VRGVKPGDQTESYTWEPNALADRRVLAFWDGGHANRSLAANARVVVGRSLDCDLTVFHASVSRRHIEVIGSDPPRVRDLGSANGTRIGARLLRRGEEVALDHGEVVQIGSAMVLVRSPLERTLAGARGATTDSPMNETRQLVDLVASSSLSVILLGETGVGKEVTARAIHDKSATAGKSFVQVNCAALAETLLDSELFGYEKGAFTGAMTAKVGLIEAADGGTLLLDEVGETSPSVQAKLLRTLETREVRRVGGVRGHPVDVRFLAATNRDLPALVESGAFRRDLYFRLNGLTIEIPPLRRRLGELPTLAVSLLREAAQAAGRSAPSLSRAALAMLTAHPFPGNVRELRNVMARAVLLCREGDIRPEHIRLDATPGHEAKAATVAPTAAPALLHDEIDALERTRILAALEESAGNQTRAAALLGIGRRTLIHRMEAYGLPRPRKKD
jgi:two-component system, NtrC family, response regulator AtoC